MYFGDKAHHTTPPNQLIVSPLSAAVTISCRSIHVCVCRKEQTRATDRAAVASVWRSLPGVMVPCGCLCIVLSSYCQLFTGDSIPSRNENLASLARPYFSMVWFTRLPEGSVIHTLPMKPTPHTGSGLVVFHLNLSSQGQNEF